MRCRASELRSCRPIPAIHSNKTSSFYDLEQAIKPRTQPQFRVGATGAASARICTTLMTTSAPKLVERRAKISHHIGTGKAVHSITAQRITAKVIEQKS